MENGAANSTDEQDHATVASITYKLVQMKDSVVNATDEQDFAP